MTRVVKPEGYIILGYEPNKWHFVIIRSGIRIVKKLLNIKKTNENFSIGDYETYGFNKKDFERLGNNNKLELVLLDRILLIAGLYALIGNYLDKIRKKKLIYKFNFYKIDSLLLKIPIINLLNWQWNVVYRK